jgi:acyl carrier protein
MQLLDAKQAVLYARISLLSSPESGAWSGVAAVVCFSAPVGLGFHRMRGDPAKDSISEKVVSTLASVKHVPAETISLDSRLEDLGIDSLDTIVLLSELEQQFRISISDDEARSIRSVRDVVEGIRKLAAPPSCEAASPSIGTE